MSKPEVVAVIKAIGGATATARMTGRGLSAVSNWKTRGKFPPDTFLVMTTALEAKGKKAPARLWGMKEPEVAA